MESQPQNPEFRNNPENFHPCLHVVANPQDRISQDDGQMEIILKLNKKVYSNKNPLQTVKIQVRQLL